MVAGLSKAGGRGGGEMPPTHFLADQLTLSQLEGAHYPHPVLHAPRFSDLATALGLKQFQWKVLNIRDAIIQGMNMLSPDYNRVLYLPNMEERGQTYPAPHPTPHTPISIGS